MQSFIDWYQHLPLIINPVLFQIGSFQLRWYSLGWLTGFTTVYLLVLYRLKHEVAFKDLSPRLFEQFYTYVILGTIVGGRLGYVLFYNFSYYLDHPLEIILPFTWGENGLQFTGISGMSFHGGVAGILVAWIWFFNHNKLKFSETGMRVVQVSMPLIPLGYTFGRLGNFMNAELYGRVTTSAWGMYFYTYDENGLKVPFTELRHPSQLYEAFFEGIVNFLFLWWLREKVRPAVLFSFYFIGYGTVRFFIEYFRQPDAQFRSEGNDLGTVLGSLSMGQLLCLAMIGFGLAVIFLTRKKATSTK